ncbi:MAG TPA: MAPEG family protein [Acetobacteraceae bacterium]
MIVAFVVWQGLARILPVDIAARLPERLGVACAALLPAVGVLNLMILTQMRLRARTGAVDPLAGHDGALLQVNQRALTNTVEQLAGFAPALLALAAGATADGMRFVVSAGIVFALARLAFWAGYLLGPMVRAPGMAATFAINFATLTAAIWVWWRGGHS